MGDERLYPHLAGRQRRHRGPSLCGAVDARGVAHQYPSALNAVHVQRQRLLVVLGVDLNQAAVADHPLRLFERGHARRTAHRSPPRCWRRRRRSAAAPPPPDPPRRRAPPPAPPSRGPRGSAAPACPRRSVGRGGSALANCITRFPTRPIPSTATRSCAVMPSACAQQAPLVAKGRNVP